MEDRKIIIEETNGEKTLLDLLQGRGVYVPAYCGGSGTCGKCRVRILNEPPAVTEAERELLSADDLEAGVRLACLTEPEVGMEVEILAGDEAEMKVETSFSVSAEALRQPDGQGSGKDLSAPAKASEKGSGQNEQGSQDRQSGQDEQSGQVEACSAGSPVVAAVDIGTTTIVMSAVDAGSGQVLGTAAGVNHQRAFGADVISRIDASNRGKGAMLRSTILRDLDLLQGQLGLPAGTRRVISGNSTMQHLLQGLSCRTLGVAPYTPVDISLHSYENMTILPGISTFVGADIVSGIVACGMDRSEEVCILVDLGTNGEMAIGNRDRIVCASTAAGPAFEGGNISCGMAGIPGAISAVTITEGRAAVETIGGAPPAGLCGTGVIEVMYELLKEEIVDETGCMDDEWIEDGFPLAEGVTFSAMDVRELQLAKAAVRAGMEVLLQAFGMDYDGVGRVYLAGGFGQKINLEKAVGIGLLPEELLDRMEPVGNSSLAGAVMAAQDPSVLERMARTAEMAQETALAENPLFSDLYMEHMFFPEQE